MSSNLRKSSYHEILSMPVSITKAKTDGSKGSANSSKCESGNENDVNGSHETLSPEERHTLKHTRRQEPQGQEENVLHSTSITVPSSHISLVSPHMTNLDNASISTSTSRNNECNLSFGSSSNTLIIHHSVPDEPWSNRWLSSYASPTSGVNSVTRAQSQSLAKMQPSVVPRNSRSPDNVIANSDAVQSNLMNPVSKGSSNASSSSGIVSKTASYFEDKISSPVSAPKYLNSTELVDIPSMYLDQSEVLKHLVSKDKSSSVFGGGNYSDQSASSSNSALNMGPVDSGSMSSSTTQSSQRMTYLGADDPDLSAILHRIPSTFSSWQLDSPSPVYEKKLSEVISKSIEKNTLSKSQPDLTQVGNLKEVHLNEDINRILNNSQSTDEHSVTKIKEMLDNLSHENSTLRLEVDVCHRKVSKLQKMEIEMSKVEEQHEALVKICERREQLERLARHKLHNEVRRLTDTNNEYKEQIDLLTNRLINQPCSDGMDSDVASLKRELNKRDVFIAQLVSQNKELIAAKERQEIELTAQRQTLNEQRTHIDILDSALTNAQTNVVKLEEEGRKKQGLVEQAGQLKRVLLSMKLSNDRREQSEKTLKQKLEMEIMQLKSNSKMDGASLEFSQMQKELREKEEKILILEGEINKWEQRFIKESVYRQMQAETTRDTSASHLQSANKPNSSSSISMHVPKKDEELESQSSMKMPPGCHQLPYATSDYSYTIPHDESSQTIQEHSRSGSYCLFINPWEQEELKPEASSLTDCGSRGILNDIQPPLGVEQRPYDASDPSSLASTGVMEETLLQSEKGDISTERGDPPPYYSHHQVIDTPQKKSLITTPSPRSAEVERTSSMVLPRMVAVCQKPHPPNAFCRTCLNVRRSHRQNAAALVRRANSSGCQHNRRSAPSPASSGESLDDVPSILERLKKEWEMGILGGTASPKSVDHKKDRSKTLPPQALNAMTLNTYSKDAADSKSFECLDIKDTKKDVAHLDRALNRLSIKRNSNQVALKHSIRSFANEDLTQLTDANENSVEGCSLAPHNSSIDSALNNNRSIELMILEDSDRPRNDPKLRDSKSLECLK